jgi:2-hydroxy-3-oxopropionate reductase
MKIGFIGLGIMGAPMALHLLNAGHPLFVSTRSRLPESIAASAAQACANAAEVTRQAEVIFIMVPDTPDVEAVLFGPDGIASALTGQSPRKVIVDMSSISPMATKAFALKINALGADYVDAPVSGGEVGADPAKVRQALMGGFAASRILEVHGERMIKRTFAPGFRIKLHQKDLGLALQGASELGLALPQTAGAAQLMQVCAANGMAELDHSALVKALELMGQHEVAQG